MAQWNVPHAVVKTQWLHALTFTFVVFISSRVSVEVLLAWRCRLSSLYDRPWVWIWWRARQPRDGDNPKHDQKTRWEVHVWLFPGISTGPRWMQAARQRWEHVSLLLLLIIVHSKLKARNYASIIFNWFHSKDNCRISCREYVNNLYELCDSIGSLGSREPVTRGPTGHLLDDWH